MSERIRSVDAVRGFAVVLMIIYHGLYDAVYYLDAPAWIVENPGATAFNYTIAVLFITISGISCRLSGNNVRRGLKFIIIALIITVVTYFMGGIIKFGILHFLGTAAVMYGFAGRYIDKLPRKLAPFIYAVLFAAGVFFTRTEVDNDYFFILGLHTAEFYSADYYPVIPWIFLFLFGTWLGEYVKEQKDVEAAHPIQCRPLEFLGRHSLAIYILHQPVMWAFCQTAWSLGLRI